MLLEKVLILILERIFFFYYIWVIFRSIGINWMVVYKEMKLFGILLFGMVKLV